MCLKWKCADLQTCTTNILIKVEKFIKYYTAVAEKYELIHLHRDLSLSMIEVYDYDYDYDYEITLFEHKQNQHIHIIIVQ